MTTLHTPDWVKHAVFYQIFPDRFARSDQVEKPRNLELWDTPPTPQGYKGGDLLGVIEHLDHIQDLGATAIYFTPIFQSASNHRYHTHDYYQVDPLLGGNAALRALLDACHARGLRVVLDGVFNHASRGFFQFNDILENGPHSPWIDWFTIEGWPLRPYDSTHPANYLSWIDNRALPKLNTDNPQAREFIMRVAEHWLGEGIDGWRLDVPFEIQTEGFWAEFRQRVKAVNPEAYIVGEVWTDARQWLKGDQFDGVMNYLFTGPTIALTAGPRVLPEQVAGRSYVCTPPLSATGYADAIDHLLGLYPWEIQLTQLNLLDSHDTARMLSIVGGDRASVRLATILQMTFPGAPSIYYGDEIGLEGVNLDHDARRAFPWSRPDIWDLEILAHYKALIAIRAAHPALRTGAFHRLFADETVYAFARTNAAETLLIAINTAETHRTVDLPLLPTHSVPDPANGPLIPDGAELTGLYGAGGARVDAGSLRLTVPAREGVILVV